MTLSQSQDFAMLVFACFKSGFSSLTHPGLTMASTNQHLSHAAAEVLVLQRVREEGSVITFPLGRAGTRAFLIWMWSVRRCGFHDRCCKGPSGR